MKLPYDRPGWSKSPDNEYYFEVLKNGVLIEKMEPISKEFLVIGRLPTCDISLEHASISRFHCILQFKGNERFLYELDSTHGTFLNKKQIPGRTFVPVRVGDMIKFGASSRNFVLFGPEDPPVVDSKIQSQPVEDEGINWGFAEDAYVGDEWEGKDLVYGPIDRSTIPDDAYYLKDPKKSLRTWLENQGEEIVTKFNEEEDSVVCIIELPIDTVKGPLMAFGHGTNKKKAEKDASIEACAKLERLGVLVSETRKRVVEFDDDYDDLYDLTDRKKTKKIQHDKQETKESLFGKYQEISMQIRDLETKREKLAEKDTNIKDDDDELDRFMLGVNQTITSQESTVFDSQIEELIKEKTRIEKILNLVDPNFQQNQKEMQDSFKKSDQREPQGQEPVQRSGKKSDQREPQEQEPVQDSFKQSDQQEHEEEPKHSKIYGVPTRQTIESQYEIETEDVVSFVPPGSNEEEARNNAKSYGY